MTANRRRFKSIKLNVICCIVLILTVIVDLGLSHTNFFQESSAKGVPAQIEIQWQYTYGENGDDVCRSLVQTRDSGFVLAGYTEYHFDKGTYVSHRKDMLLVKTDAQGEQRWKKTFNLTDSDVFTSLVQTPDGSLVMAGYTADGFYLMKTNEDGEAQWNRTYGIGGCAAEYGTLIQTMDDGFALAGDIHCRKRISLLKTDAEGILEWNRTYGGTEGDVVSSLVQTPDGGFALAGGTYSFGASQFDMLLVKTDAEGVEQWHRTYGGAKDDECRSLIQTADGGFVLVGDKQANFWLVKTDADGNEQWQKIFGGSRTDRAFAHIQTADGGFALIGYTTDLGNWRSDIWLVKTDKNGTLLWYRVFGGLGDDHGFSLLQTADRNFVLAGYTNSHDSDNLDFWLLKTGSITEPDTDVHYRIAEISETGTTTISTVSATSTGTLPSAYGGKSIPGLLFTFTFVSLIISVLFVKKNKFQL